MSVRIGVDMLGEQDPGGRRRGIGRYTRQFVHALTQADPVNQYVLYFFDRLAPCCWEGDAGVESRVVSSGHGPLAEAVQRLVDRNPDRLDLYLVTSPFSEVEGYRLPVQPTHRPHLAAILYDLIPLVVDQDFYLGSEPVRRNDYFERLDRLRNYALNLAISEATRQDALLHLAMPESRVVNVSAATRTGHFSPPQSSDLPRGLQALRIKKPYVFSVASMDPHKNTRGLIRAFARIPLTIRAGHQLVIAGAQEGPYQSELAGLACQYGIGPELVLIGHVSDERLREAYQHCAVFAFVSHYEGFGLPIVEAMESGTAVVAGNNSAQVEVVAGAGLLAQTDDDADVADKLGQILSDAGLAATLRRLGRERARTFSWPETVRRARSAFQALPRGPGSRPLLAFFAALPPRRSGAAEQALALLHGLRRHYTIHLYHDAGRVPHIAWMDSAFAAFDHRLFEQHDRVWNYHAVLYQLDDADPGGYIARTLRRRPGIVTAHSLGLTPGLFDQALQVIVHDAGVADCLRATMPNSRDRIRVIPQECHSWESIVQQYVAVIEKVVATGGHSDWIAA